MAMKLTRIAYRNIARNIRRSILSGSAIAVSAMSIVLLFALIGGMEKDMANNLKTYYTGEIRIRNADFEKFERYNPLHLSVDLATVTPILKRNPSIVTYAPRINFPASMYLGENNHAVMGVGVDFSKEAEFIDFPSIIKEGKLPQPGKNEMLMGSALAKELKLSLGDKITLLSTTAVRGSNAITLQLVGIVSFPVAPLNASSLWAPLDRVQHFLRMDGTSQEIILRVSEGTNEKETAIQIKDEIASATGQELEVKAWKDLNTLYGMIELASIVYYFIGAFFLFLGSTVIINTTMMVIFERMREIGTLSALGMRGRELTRLFFLEGLFISIIGAGVGVILGMAITQYLGITGLNFTDAMSGIDMEISSILYPSLSIPKALLIYVYSVAISSAATFIPSRRASKIQPVEALRYV
ncbi:ABC-type transport system, involved in lipoprotein release, permease component [Sphaerochaeta pleomorpha str. Grapes]|uniref:ABC-type transport system, involved in lipoprotein release, permease component n=2 Tax=Sphaerochaeta TaxID=399320 RepID=G8QRZ3_SPHPG|nr:ABC-type transport system, involved in lipoprotein release, permease component [Sphaerochaeta pleomorpha str. Grapes]